VTEEKTPVEKALDLFVFAPLGLALSAREALPGLAQKGRQVVDQQVAMARMMGQFAVTAGRQEAEKRLKTLRDDAETRLETLAGGGRRPAPAPAPAAAASPARTAPAAPAEGPQGADLEHAAAVSIDADEPPGLPEPSTPDALVVTEPTPLTDGLAIPGYDTLAASQIVQRLAGLSRDELEAVRDYESHTRGRKTILNRVAQLQGVNGAG
jgi:hypothetical protein